MNGGRGHGADVGAHIRRSGAGRGRSLLIVVACAAALLASCTGPTAAPSPSVAAPPNGAPAASPRPTASATPTPTPDAAVKPERPAAMDEVSAAGAEAVAVYFLQLFPYVYATGDLTEWRELSHPECIFCASVTAGAEEMRALGELTEGGLVEISALTSIETDPGRWYLVSCDLNESSSTRFDDSGQPVEQFAEKDYRMDVAVVREGGTWAIRELTHTLVD